MGSEVLGAAVVDESASVTAGGVGVDDAEVVSVAAASLDEVFEEGSDMLGTGCLLVWLCPYKKVSA